jgi:hypothetical protein
MSLFRFASAAALLFVANCRSQTLPSEKAPAPAAELTYKSLFFSDDMIVTSEPATSVFTPLRCDSDGNLYLMNQVDAVSAIHKFNSKGQQVALFQSAAATDVKIATAAHFSVSKDGDVYQLAFKEMGGGYPRGVLDQHAHVLIFGKDGRYKSSIKLGTEFGWLPLQVAPFASGDFLIVGVRDDAQNKRHRQPFTGIFSSNGSLIKLVKLEDDGKLNSMAISGDQHVVSPDHPFNNFAVERGALQLAGDGNVYVMRRVSPAIVYAITAGGAVLRRFTVDPGEPNYVPISMHIDRYRIAILFQEPQTRDKTIRIVDLEGNDVNTYRIPYQQGSVALGTSMICYTEVPERFTFVSMKGDKLAFKFAEPH